MTKYVLPLLAVAVILFFYLGLPQLTVCPLPEREKVKRRIDRKDALIAGIITLLYAAAAFYNLGNTASPRSFLTGGSDPIQIELKEASPISRMTVFTGMTIGSWEIAVSEDGEDWTEISELDQNYAAILKWQDIDLTAEPEINVKYIRMTASRAPRLGEIGVYDGDGKLMRYASCPEALCDEQDLVPETQTYLNSSYFDEIYHVRTAVEHIEQMEPYEISHPPLGKLVISAGIMLFGMTPFGWRFMGTLFGVLMLPVMYCFAKRLYGGREVPSLCTILFAAEFMHFTQTRIATIDTYAVFYILLMYLFMYEFIESDRTGMLGLSGLFFGLGAASKWTCIYAGAGLAVIWLLYWIVNMKRRGFAAFLKNVLLCLLFFVAVPAVIYYLAYTPYGTARGMNAPGMYFTKDYLQIVLDNQKYMFNYHSGVTATHPYSSRWYQWVLDIRPILYYLQYGNGTARSSFGAFMNPLICWGGLLGLFAVTAVAVLRREKTAAFLVTAYFAQLVPWMFINRVTFEYHYFPCSVFLILILGYVFELMRKGAFLWRLRAYGFTAASCSLFFLFYPVLSGAWTDSSFTGTWLRWLPTWPF